VSVISIRRTTLLVIALAVAVTTALAAPAEAKRIRPGFFGMHDARITYGAQPAADFGSLRLWDSGTAWRQIETRRGRFDFTNLDRAVSIATTAGVRPLLALGQTPRFHATRRNAAGSYGPGSTSMPRIRAWKRYVAKVARRYGNRIDYQIWNEPNVIQYWSGSPAQMAKLTAVASRQIRRVVDGRPTIAAPSFPLRLEKQRRWYRSYWSQRVGGKGMASFVTATAANLYPEARRGPEAQLALQRFARRAMPPAARSKPLWNTEINYGLEGGGVTAKRLRPRVQAAYAARTLLLNTAMPVKRVYWYSWTIGDFANTHLSREDDRSQRTRAGRAWDEVRSWLVGTRVRSCRQSSRGVWTCTYKAGRTEVRRVYWKPSGSRVTVRTHRSTRQVTSLGGRTRATDGRVRLRVGAVPAMVTSRR
jgi:polysaccharide biosynthesis protein PslG